MSRTPTPARSRTEYEPPTAVGPALAAALAPLALLLALSSPAVALLSGLAVGAVAGAIAR